MTQSLVGIELETGGVLMKFLQTTVETGGALHAQEARYPAHSMPAPYHRHPHQDERFVILEGAIQFRIAGRERVARKGDEIPIPKGTLHRAHNPHAEPAVVLWETRPALRTGEFFYALSRASRARARPKLVDAAAILHEFRDEFELPAPPRFVQRVLFGCLAPFGRGVLRDLQR